MFKKSCTEVYVFLPLYMFGIARIVNSSSVSDRNVEDINLTESLSSNNSAKLLKRTCVNDDVVGGRVCMIPYKLKLSYYCITPI